MANLRAPHLGESIDDEECRRATSIAEISALVAKRWNSGILLALSRGVDRFGQLEAIVQGISARMLSARLRELEQHNLVQRVVIPTTPVSVRYSLTERGHVVLASINALAVER